MGGGVAVGTPVGVGDSAGAPVGAAVGAGRVIGAGVGVCSRVTVGRGDGWMERVAAVTEITGAGVAVSLVPHAATTASGTIKNPINSAFIEYGILKI